MDAEQLDKHLKETPSFIRRHRGRMIAGSVGYTENPTFSGFGPSSPVDEGAMEMADMEAAFIGNLARYCMAMGTIPQRPRRGFWWVNGVCRGMKCAMVEDEFDLHGEHDGTDVLAPIQELVDYLRVHVGAILNTEGVEPLLRAGEETRWYSLKMFPGESQDDRPQWVNLADAMDLTGRSARTLDNWVRAGTVARIGTGEGAEYLTYDLEAQMKVVRENMIKRSIEARERLLARKQ